MENAVERLEAMFQKADSDVNHLSQRLKFEFENNEDIKQTNPAELVKKISDVKKEFASIMQQAEAVKEAEKEAVGEFKSHINDVCQLLLKLQSNTGSPPTEKPEELCRLEKFIGSEIPWGEGSTLSVSGGSGDGASVGSNNTDATNITHQKEDDEPECSACSSDNEMSPSSKRKTTHEFVEVSQPEFESVSSLIRGKVKLTEVNSTYRTLWDHFKSKKKCTSITPTEMNKIGLRVTGMTGLAKLKVLRALKLLKISSKGDVSLISS